MKNQFGLKLILAVVNLVILTVVGGRTAAVQALTWSPQRRIPVYDDLTVFAGPILIADQNRTVHAFNGQTFAENEVAIVYRQWTLEQGWTAPIDILLTPDNRLPAHVITLGMGAFLDQAGIVHLVFVSGDDNVANVYYARAPLVLAGQAPSWSVPVAMVQQAQITLPSARITGDGAGNLFVLFSGESEGNGLYATRSDDGGNNWSEPDPVFLTYRNALWPSKLEIVTGTPGGMHAVWGVTGADGLSEAIYYASLGTDQTAWSEPIELARAFGFQADAPAIVEYEGELFVTYHNDSPTTIWMRRSHDGGRNWTRPERFSPDYVGSNGAVSFVIDGSNTLHAFFGNRVGNPAIHGMWHREWLDDHWGEVEAVVAGPRIMDRLGGKGFDPSGARAVISQGNTLLVTWLTDGGAGENGAWYSYATLDTPELPVVPLPRPQIARATPTAAVSTTATPAPAPTYHAAWADESDSVSGNRNTFSPAAPLAAAVAPVVLLLALAVVFRRKYPDARL